MPPPAFAAPAPLARAPPRRVRVRKRPRPALSAPLHPRRSKMILTRRIHSWTLRRSRSRARTRAAQPAAPPPAAPPPEPPATEPVPAFVVHRPASYPLKRRPGDPPARFLQLSYSLVEPARHVTNCSNPAATGALKTWYHAATRWNVLSSDTRPPLRLSSDRLFRRTPPAAPPPAPLLTHPAWARSHARHPRIIAIGDVHGCISELQALLRLADYTPGDQVILLGDLVAKGPDSVAVVQLAREIGARTVRGNHDFEVVRWWEARRRGSREQVSVEHARIARSLSPAEHAWLVDAPWFIECPDMSHLFVHAGFIPGVKLTQQNPRLMMNMRSVLADGTVTAKNVGGCEWAKLWKGPQTVVFGHDAFRGLQVYDFAKGIDTGCVYGGRLTALLLPENRLISVAAKRAYISPKRFRALRDQR